MSKPHYKLEEVNPYAQNQCDGCEFIDCKCPQNESGRPLCETISPLIQTIFVQVKEGE